MNLKIACHPTERVRFRWPLEYWNELLRKLTKRGHEVVFFADEATVEIKTDNPKVSFVKDPTLDTAIDRMREVDLFIGPPLRFYNIADTLGKPVIGLLGSDLNGKGIKPDYVPCSGCHTALENRVDCFFGDEMCMAHLTPQMVMKSVREFEEDIRG